MSPGDHTGGSRLRAGLQNPDKFASAAFSLLLEVSTANNTDAHQPSLELASSLPLHLFSCPTNYGRLLGDPQHAPSQTADCMNFVPSTRVHTKLIHNLDTTS